MRYLYTFLFYLALPFIWVRLQKKGRKNAAYTKRLGERFSWGPIVSPKVDVWVHAVSLGEVVAAKTLVEQLLAEHQRVLITTMTPTGSEQVLRQFGQRVSHQYVPYDFPWALRRFFTVTQPRVGIIMETELWPNMIAEARLHGVTLFLANARISDDAFKTYQHAKYFFKPFLAQFTGILAQSAHDAKRFCALGAPSDHVRIMGNMKSDLEISKHGFDALSVFKHAWGEARPVVILGSTHEGEEQQIFSVFRALQQAVPEVVLLVAPRHPERFESVYQLACAHGFKTSRRSQQASIQHNTEVVVLDCLGELLGFYALSDYAFVGGSFVPVGGHNVLEPMALSVPVFCGMFMQNSKSLCEELLRVRAMQQVESAAQLVKNMRALHHDLDARAAQIKRATDALKASQGAVARHIEVIRPYLKNKAI
ncbi:MAG: lipid IV(A) 3-deoxy-D-manno-octulosonic acid transferase [Legionellaceae bacterium]|nr:lipid IV(A) 3-deoxy-D-manno-octulosonic acid transferase [Legionellaceae bacterium]